MDYKFWLIFLQFFKVKPLLTIHWDFLINNGQSYMESKIRPNGEGLIDIYGREFSWSFSSTLHSALNFRISLRNCWGKLRTCFVSTYSVLSADVSKRFGSYLKKIKFKKYQVMKSPNFSLNSQEIANALMYLGNT